VPVVTEAERQNKKEYLKPSDLIDSLREHANSPRAQKMLLGMVADAALAGGRMMPEIRRMLDEGIDITFTSYKPDEPGYPSLRVALLAAAEATGDPAAVKLLAEVAATSESPVEVVFSAHMLDRLDALDAETAHRALDVIAKPLSKDQWKAMSSVLKRVVPAAAAADPAYAETFLTTHMRATADGKGLNSRLLAPVLDGLPIESVRNIVLSAVNANDIPDRTKALLASRAAQRKELSMLQDLRSAIESNTLSERVIRSVATSSIRGRAYSVLRKQAWSAIKKGNLGEAQKLAKSYEARLAEAAKTIKAARATGAKLPRNLATRATLMRQQLNEVLARIRAAHRKRERQAAAARKNR